MIQRTVVGQTQRETCKRSTLRVRRAVLASGVGDYDADLQRKLRPSTRAVNDTFANLRAGVNQAAALETSAFMWEWFTTKPFADSGEVRFIGSVPTPWPSWTIAASKADGVSSSKQLSEFQDKLQESIAAFTAPAAEDASLRAIETHFSYKSEDVRQWWTGVRWVQDQRGRGGASELKGQHATTQTVSKDVLLQTLDVLEKAGVVKRPVNTSGAWDTEAFCSSQRLSE